MLNYTKRESILQDDHSTKNIKFTDISLMVRGTPAHVKCYSYLGMLIPGYLDTRVPCGLPGSRPESRETSDLPSYRERFHQSTDCPCGHIQASTALAAAENAEPPVC